MLHCVTTTPEFIHKNRLVCLGVVAGRVYRMATMGERCCSTCTFHIHRDPSCAVSACGRCVIHTRCLGAISACELCCLPIGQVDTVVLTTCNTQKCTNAGSVLCPECAASLAERFQCHLSKMGRLGGSAIRGWITSFGHLRDASREAVVGAVFNVLVSECSRGFQVRFDSEGVAEHFTENLFRLSLKFRDKPTSYAEIVALDPALPPEAAVALRRFVGERRRHWYEHPKTRNVLLKDRDRPSAGPGRARDLFARVSDPGGVVTENETNGKFLLKRVRQGEMHTLGRGVFYYNSLFGPKTAKQSRKRAIEWLTLFD